MAERAAAHSKDCERSPGEGRGDDLANPCKVYVAGVQEWATTRAAGDLKKLEEIRDTLLIDKKTPPRLAPDVVGATWADFPGEEAPEPEGE
eukprot:g16431.t1